MSEREANLLRSVTETTWRFYVWVGLLSVVVLLGLSAYVQQLRDGLIVTGMRDQVSWGLYITNFVFFIGISHAGTLISAILRVTQTGWRRPITRMAEAITVFALCIGAPMVVIDLGRPERVLNLMLYGRLQSPILWDVLAVITYLTGCVLYFYFPLIPDLAVLAAQPSLAAWRRRLYRALSLGWTGSAAEMQLLERAISVMAVVIIPLAVSVHTVVSWIFAMTLRPGWDSSIFGPYFVVGAIYSGAAAVILSMYILRRIFRLEGYLEPAHFRNLGLLLLTFAMLYAYFNINEYLTVGYKFEGMEKLLAQRLLWGDFAPYFWCVQALGVLIPLLLLMAVLGMKRHQQFVIPGVALASLLAVAGAWAKRYLIVVPTMGSPYLPVQGVPQEWAHYQPTWVEWSITAAAFAGFLLIYTLLAKLFPMVSIWETRADEVVQASPEARVAGLAPAWRTVPPISALFIAILLAGPGSAQAANTGGSRKPAATVLSVEWRALPAPAGKPAWQREEVRADSPSRVFLLTEQMFGFMPFGSQSPSEEKTVSAMALTASLRTENGLPLAFQVVRFALKTSFGSLDFGSRPTDAAGKAQLVIRDHRYGGYPLQVVFPGDEIHRASRAEVLVEFGPRPAPALPRQGVLITPYPTAGIVLPFLLFYGTIWIVFAYAFGYLVLWRLRRAGQGPDRQLPGISESLERS